MATRKQIEANRKNAAKSTGPRTVEGKSITRLNAKRDGFTGQVTTLSEQDRPIFEKFKSDLIADLSPRTTLELSLAASVAWDTWRLNHLRAIELNMYALGTDDAATAVHCGNAEVHTAMTGALTFANEAQKFALMSIYEQRLNRSLHKNLATLRELQAERKRRYDRDRAQEVAIARYSDIKGLPYQVPSRPSSNGFVFSNQEIFSAANRLTTLKVAKIGIRQEYTKIQFAGASAGASTNVVNWPENRLNPDAA